jgi:pimeloyl-ACP methyl ester carboxylesterase
MTIEVEAAGAVIAVERLGDGPPVVLLPSQGRGVADFAALAETLAGAGFGVILPEPRAIGASRGSAQGSAGRSAGDVTLHDLAADVAAVIERLSPGPAAVIGHAFGNRVARCLAADRPALVRRVVLLAAGGKAPVAPEIMTAFADCFRLDLPEARRLAAIRSVFFAPGNDPAVWLDGWWPDASALQTAADQATPVDDWWTAGTAPLLVIQGLSDPMAPPENGRLLKRALGDRVRLVELERASHALLPERPEAIAAAAIDYLGA